MDYLIIIILWMFVGGFDWVFDLFDCLSVVPLSLEDQNDIILNGLFAELFDLIPKDEFKAYLDNLEFVYDINLDKVEDMTLEVQEKIKLDINKVLNEIKSKKLIR